MDLLTTLFLAWICIAIGYFSNRFIAGLRAQKQGAPPDEQPPSGGGSSPPGGKDVIRLWREPRGGRLIVEINGRLIPSAQDLNAEERRRVALAAADLRTWLGVFPQPASSAGVESGSAVSSAGARQANASKPEQAGQISRNPFKVFTRAFQELDKPKVAPSAVSIAAQIDEILQEKIAATPLEGRGIRLLELPGQGMVVMIGLDKYEGVEAVPDAEIRSLLRQAVAEWEARVTGK